MESKEGVVNIAVEKFPAMPSNRIGSQSILREVLSGKVAYSRHLLHQIRHRLFGVWNEDKS